MDILFHGLSQKGIIASTEIYGFKSVHIQVGNKCNLIFVGI